MKLGGRAILAVGALASAACSGADVSKPAVAGERAVLADVLSSMNGRCPGLEPPSPSVRSPDDTLFVELAILDTPTALAEQASLGTLRDVSRSERLRLLGTPHVIAKWDQAVEMGSGTSAPPDADPTVSRWSVLPRRAEGAAVLELEVDLQVPRPGSASAALRPLAFALTVRPNEPTLARVVWDEASHRSLLLLVRVFEVQGQGELRAIFECKMQEHHGALRLQRLNRASGEEAE